jgi:hypothetical protein
MTGTYLARKALPDALPLSFDSSGLIRLVSKPEFKAEWMNFFMKSCESCFATVKT